MTTPYRSLSGCFTILMVLSSEEPQVTETAPTLGEEEQDRMQGVVCDASRQGAAGR